ncbi:MAG: 50S ribosomal protein L15 [Candidatus Lokiarchaeota archaeon]|nr:50S ribosomal protein L15 [Candidatus Lokiarchaeota archaeon]
MKTKRTPKRRLKFRGSREHGYGKIGQHRKAGQRGGKGKYTGGQKHLWSYIVKYEPDYYGKKGFQRPPFYMHKMKIVNVEDLETIAIKNNSNDLNLIEFGFEKVLGKGTITKALKITAKAFSKSAIQKIENAGGQCIPSNTLK